MRITDVRCTMLRIPDVRPIADGTQDTLIVQVFTDAGIVGLGEAHTSPWVAKAVIEAPLSHYMARGLREILRGTDPLQIEQRWDDMYRYTQVFGRRGITLHAISAIDIALWDILGKALGKPIHALLGGARRQQLRPYASILALESAEAAVARARELVDRGFSAIKFGWSGLGHDVQRDLDTVATLRESVGTGVELMLDIGAPMERDAALRLARGLETLDVYFLEEPLAPDDVDGYAELAAAVALPIAAGEKETTRWGFKPFIDARALDIVQPDIARVGGLSEARRVADHADLNGVRVIPHCWSTDILVAATCHFLATRQTDTFLEYCLIDTPIRNDVAREPILAIDGVVRVPDGPGLGIELNLSTLERYAYTLDT